MPSRIPGIRLRFISGFKVLNRLRRIAFWRARELNTKIKRRRHKAIILYFIQMSFRIAGSRFIAASCNPSVKRINLDFGLRR